MKLISLNIWGGHIETPLVDFFDTYKDVDVFCLQEVYHNAPEKVSTCNNTLSLHIFDKIAKALPEHKGYFRPVVGDVYGLAIFAKKELAVVEENETWIHKWPDFPGKGPKHQRNIQWLTFQRHEKAYTIFNVHGLWNGMGKTDTTDRIAQSKRIHEAVNAVDTPNKILCGDFNLKPDTKSLQIASEGLIDLIKTHGITSTRTSYYPKEERFADYIFTSPSITTHAFSVMSEEVSDHAALLLDFE